ncbi:MAG: ABC transporter substrate-binding protein [Gammaproteobacteria bacterium]|nr:ABC transporter substrate-binding protein [Gammaproteobacteria bacterium]NIR85603.1 ABC transporter substrate-binding protein [Gammaproteobacteria bacterium]NIR90044.1 ABC transporter substrate-binding protein [Gammaproteobacteria bacterium]NIU06732.1 ABC transporter substrate-binding protein [Gammaproteobacteria bacterium]NIV53663.1 extracellular solute-binding protein [Gammaproteobacteria bacterium]
MRNPLFNAATAIGLAGTMIFSAPAGAQQSLTVVSGGGAYAKSQIEAYHKPFAKETGIAVNAADYNYELGPIRAQVESGNVNWDVAVVEEHAALRGCEEGLFTRIDASILPPAPDDTPATEDFIEETIGECAVGEVIWSLVYAYDKNRYSGAKPQTAADFFDLERFPGKRGMKKWAKGNLEYALMADGVPPERVYDVLSTEEGVNRAFAKLDTIKDEVVWWEAGAQPVQLLADGEVAMTTAFNGRLFNAIVKEGQPFEIVWDGQNWNLDMWAIVRGTKRLDAARRFVAFASRPDRMADQTNYISYSPVRRSALELAAKDVKPHLPTYPENFKNALKVDVQWWGDNLDTMNERFNAWLAR